MGVRPREIEVFVEELVLEGFSPADRLRIGSALEIELARLLREGELPSGLASDGEREGLDAGSFAHSPLATAPALGESLARSVYAGLSR